MAFEAVLSTIPTGPYLNGIFLLVLLVLVFLWACWMAWVDKDSLAVNLPRQMLNLLMMAGFIVALFIFLTVPLGTTGAFSAFGGIFVAEIGVYLGLRYQKAGLSDLTTELSGLFSRGGRTPKEAKAVAGQVLIVNKSGTPMPPPDANTPERHQYDAAQLILADPLRKNADRIDLAVTADGAAFSYFVDGYKYDGAIMDRNAATGAVNYLKFTAGLDMNERRKPQVGMFKTVLDGSKREIRISTKGSSSGESLSLIVDPKQRHGFTVDKLGFTESQLKTVKGILYDNGGLVLLAAPVGQGLTAMEYAIMRAHDAFLQHLVTIERTTEQELEGVNQNVIGAAATAADEAKQVSWVISQEPDVILAATIEDSNSARDLAGYSENPKKRAYVGLRSSNTFESLRHWRKLVGDDNLAIGGLRMIIASRMVRKLCDVCKVAYTPDPTLLKKLNMDPAHVTKLYQARSAPMRDNKGRIVPCLECLDLAYKGRLPIYEILLIDEDVRQLILRAGSDNELKAAFRKQRGRYLQELALELVEQGLTSVNEVQRVLRPPEPSRGAAASKGSKS
jgi:type II secretory ATPase GspE/PulE/Tfp pilus assembly ATPase PilB-like protein